MCALDAETADEEPSGELFKRLIQLSRANKEGLVSVAGPKGIEALSVLCREDFQRVQCAREATCGGADDASDALIFAGVLKGKELISQVQRTLRLLRDDGVLALQLDQLDDDCDLQNCLQASGFEVNSAVFDLSHEVLVAHHVSRRAALQKTG